MDEAGLNEDKVIYVAPPKDGEDEGYTPKLFITRDGSLGIGVGCYVIVRPIETWHGLAMKRD